MTDSRLWLPKLDGYCCFGCGTKNPIGLQMAFYCEGQTICSDITLNQNHVGWEDIAHGGLISTVLDEIMGWSVIAFKRVFFLTRSIEVRFLRPVQVNTPIKAVGKIESETPGRMCVTHGVLLDPDKNKLAEARAQMSFLPEERVEELNEEHRRAMQNLFRKMEAILPG